MTSLAARAAGMVRAPRATAAALLASTRPPWVDVLLLSTGVMFASIAALTATSVGQTALVDQWERTALAFGQPVNDAFYGRLQELSHNWLAYSLGTAVLMGPILTLIVTGILSMVLRALGQSTVSAWTTLSVVAHANVIVALRQLVAAPINYLGETLASPTTLGQFLAGFDEASPVARFLGALDLFVVWYAVVLAIGVAVMARRRIPSLVFTFTGAYVAIALLLALAMAATGGMA